MNTAPSPENPNQNPPSTSAPSPAQAPVPTPEPSAPPADDAPALGKRRNGKVARKPKVVRDKLNVLMRDGVPYKEIIAALGEDGVGLNEDNLTNWRPGGHQDWLQQQDALDEWSAKWEFAQDLVNRGHGLTIHQVLNQTIASNIHEVISETGPAAIHDAIKADPRNIIPLIQAIATLADAEINCERYRNLEAAPTPNALGANPKSLKPETLKRIEHDLHLM